jgi:glycosyltransferase involved in cell wall biosynthesis
MKKILLIYAKSSLELLNRQSALGSYIFCLCEILQKNQMQVFVNGIDFQDLKKHRTQTISNSKSGVGILKKIIPISIKEILKDFIVFRNITRLYNSLIHGDYDCILEFYNYGSDLGYRVSSLKKIPLVLVYDAPVLEEYVFFHGEKIFFKRKIQDRELKTLLKADQIIAYSNAVKNYLISLSGRPMNISIHQNVDFTRFDFLEKQFADKTLNIGFIGSFLKWHRIDILLSAFDKLRKHKYLVELYLIGYGMEYDSIKKSVENSDYREFIHMPGFMDGRDLLEVKKMLHIGVMPGSNWYGAPNKIFEYGAAKLAVIAPSTPTIEDIFSNNNELLLFRQDDPDDLYEKLKLLCDERMLTAQLAESLQKKIREKYSEKITADFYCNVLSRAMKNN